MRIWKWQLGITDHAQVLLMPVGAKVLTVQAQGRWLSLWALVDEAPSLHPKESRAFAVYGTGNPIPEDPGEYIATVQTHAGDLVWHVFELPWRPAT